MKLIFDVIMTTLLSFASIILTLRIIKGVMLKTTDRVLQRYFATTDIYKDSFNKYKKQLALEMGVRFFAIGELKTWQIQELVKVFFQYDFDIQKIVASEEIYYAMALCLSKSAITLRDKQNVMKLGYYLGKEATADQVERFVKIIIAKNNLLSLIKTVKEITTSGK